MTFSEKMKLKQEFTKAFINKKQSNYMDTLAQWWIEKIELMELEKNHSENKFK